MDKKERIEKYGSFLYCADRRTICMGMNNERGICAWESCILDDPAYWEQQAAIAKRRVDMLPKHREHRRADKEAAANAHRQTWISKDVLRKQIQRKEEQMKKCYTRGWTKLGDRIGRELADIERRLEADAR